MNEIHEKVLSLFRLNHMPTRTKQAVRCIYHDDRNASAVLYFSDKAGGGWFHCSVCKGSKSRTLRQVLKDKGISVRNEKQHSEEIKEEKHPDLSEFKPGLTDVELLEMLWESKGIEAATIAGIGGFISKYEYLVLPYGLHGKKVARYLGDNPGMPRFVNTEGGHRGFLGEECIRKHKILIMVEGVTCYLILKQLGFENVIAPFGSDIEDNQAYMLRGKTVFILFDRDFAGFTGAEEAKTKIIRFGGNPIIAELYEPDFDYGQNKIDVNYLAVNDRYIFVKWLLDRLNNYKESDEKYLVKFKEAPPLRFYKSDLSILNFTQGLYFISGDSGVGKTSMGVGLLDNFTDQGARTLYVNYDLPKAQIISRIASRQSEHIWTEIEADHSIIEPKVWKWLEQKLKLCKIANDLTIQEIVHSKDYFDVIIIDYFQQIPWTGSDERIGLNTNLKPLSVLTSSEDAKTVVCISRESLNGNPISGTNAAKYNCQGGVHLKKVSDDILMAETFKNTRGPEDMAYYKVAYGHQRILEQTTYAKRMEDPEVQSRLNLV